MQVILVQPRGFCAGVVRAIEIVQRALDFYGEPVYVLHEIVHNRHVIESLRERGVRFVETLEGAPRGALTIFSAHGVSTEVADEAADRGLRTIDATCPLVRKVHLQAQRYSRQGLEVLIIGHPGHREVEGTLGRIEGPAQVLSRPEEVEGLRVGNPHGLAYVTQTTLSVDDTRDVIDALKVRYPTIRGPNLKDICYATQSRQNAVRRLPRGIDTLLVVGARNSSNSNRLREVGKRQGLRSFLIEDAEELRREWFCAASRVAITAGASTPEVLVQGVLDALRRCGRCVVKEMEGEREATKFRLPESIYSHGLPGPAERMGEFS